ncbi:unnamed protein product, partial [Vitis vinifera]|uniref:peroxidase n=1 Tax=Vitis vinifera TaxID=29760 RepID=D7TC14_VITVI
MLIGIKHKVLYFCGAHHGGTFSIAFGRSSRLRFVRVLSSLLLSREVLAECWNKRPLTINLGVLVSTELCRESIERNPINGSFCRSLGNTGREKFVTKGLNNHDLITLVGAHTIGLTDCSSFQYRLYNFTAKGNVDPTINQAFLAQLRALCPDVGGNVSKRGVPPDKDSQFKFDVSFFKNVRDGNGVLESDQRLFGDSETQRIVKNYVGNGRGLLGLRFY